MTLSCSYLAMSGKMRRPGLFGELDGHPARRQGLRRDAAAGEVLHVALCLTLSEKLNFPSASSPGLTGARKSAGPCFTSPR